MPSELRVLTMLWDYVGLVCLDVYFLSYDIMHYPILQSYCFIIESEAS